MTQRKLNSSTGTGNINAKTNYMKLTKLQRHTIYIIMKEEEECDMGRGFCLIWDDLFNEDTWSGKLKLKNILPELWENRTQEPQDNSSSWFMGGTERLIAIEQCIIETY